MPETKSTLETLLRGLNILSLYTRETPALTLTEITKLEMGLRAVAVPILDNSKRVVAAVNITGFTSSISQERLVGDLAESVRNTAAQITQALGYMEGVLQFEP